MKKPIELAPELPTADELAELRLFADRYRWLRQRSVRVQGSEIWYSGNALDLRVDVGLGHVHGSEVDDLPEINPTNRKLT